MDFKPTRNTLYANYAATFGALGLILYLSTAGGGVSRYYYSPEYSSHVGYGGTPEQSCRQCHVQPFAKVTDANCWMAGCHTNFNPALAKAKDSAEALQRRSLVKDEFGNTPAYYGAHLGYHDLVAAKFSCAECHPSHTNPGEARFNHNTLQANLDEALSAKKKVTGPERKKLAAVLYHQGAERTAGTVSCAACHVGDLAALDTGANAGQKFASLVEELDARDQFAIQPKAGGAGAASGAPFVARSASAAAGAAAGAKEPSLTPANSPELPPLMPAVPQAVPPVADATPAAVATPAPATPAPNPAAPAMPNLFEAARGKQGKAD